MITVRYFASLREQLGSEERLMWRQGLSVASLRDALIGMDASHAAALSRDRAVRCALNQLMSGEDALIPDGAEVAFFPPVTGG